MIKYHSRDQRKAKLPRVDGELIKKRLSNINNLKHRTILTLLIQLVFVSWLLILKLVILTPIEMLDYTLHVIKKDISCAHYRNMC